MEAKVVMPLLSSSQSPRASNCYRPDGVLSTKNQSRKVTSWKKNKKTQLWEKFKLEERASRQSGKKNSIHKMKTSY